MQKSRNVQIGELVSSLVCWRSMAERALAKVPFNQKEYEIRHNAEIEAAKKLQTLGIDITGYND